MANDGVVNILKPAGMTSHDVVAKVRRIYQTKKVGHTGTLDPEAVGVLPICVGQATRLVEYLTEKDKRYRVLLKFGRETDTQDATGNVIKETAVCTLEREAFAELLDQFVGEIKQVPPMYSAIKKDGSRFISWLGRGSQSRWLHARSRSMRSSCSCIMVNRPCWRSIAAKAPISGRFARISAGQRAAVPIWNISCAPRAAVQDGRQHHLRAAGADGRAAEGAAAFK